MDENLEAMNETDSFLEDLDYMDYEFSMDMFKYTFTAIMIISLITEFMILLLITRTKRMERRTYIIFLNWLAWEALNVLTVHTLRGSLRSVVYLFDAHHSIECIVDDIEPWAQLASFFLMIVLASDILMESKKEITKIILITVYSLLVTLVGIKSYLCIEQIHFRLIGYSTMISVIILILVVVTKDIVRCYRYRRSGIKSSPPFRVNAARIYAYFWCFFIVAFLIAMNVKTPYLFDSYIYISIFINPVFLLICLLFSDNVYQANFIKIIKCDFKYNEIDATVSFDKSEDVNINIGNSV